LTFVGSADGETFLVQDLARLDHSIPSIAGALQNPAMMALQNEFAGDLDPPRLRRFGQMRRRWRGRTLNLIIVADQVRNGEFGAGFARHRGGSRWSERAHHAPQPGDHATASADPVSSVGPTTAACRTRASCGGPRATIVSQTGSRDGPVCSARGPIHQPSVFQFAPCSMMPRTLHRRQGRAPARHRRCARALRQRRQPGAARRARLVAVD